jgi:hypothetical protein
MAVANLSVAHLPSLLPFWCTRDSSLAFPSRLSPPGVFQASRWNAALWPAPPGAEAQARESTFPTACLPSHGIVVLRLGLDHRGWKPQVLAPVTRP